ncbi:MAG TPA: hypothetical protein VFJ17_02165 [Mycobacteriales bacterium]|nr:hypothetical protein [Mycobacteriales bacterium]
MTALSVLSRHRVIALVTAGVVAGGVGGAVISQLGVATASSPSPSPSAGFPGGPGMMRGFGPGGPGALGLLGGLGAGGRLLHGEATVQKPGGGTMVVRFQHGVISDVSASTMTVKSTDGFTATYTVDKTSSISLNGADGTLSKLAKNDQVRVLAVQSGSSSVAKMVLDGVPARGMFGELRPGTGMGWAFRHRQHMQQSPPTSGANG